MPPQPYRERPGRHAAVAAVWSFTAAQSETALIPADGCFDLIVRTNAGGLEAFVSIPTASPHQATHCAGDAFVGVRLRPGFGAVLAAQQVRAAERFAVDDAHALEALVIDALDGPRKPPRIVLDFVAEARAAAGRLCLTSRLSPRQTRELQQASHLWLGMTPKAFLRIERVSAAADAIRADTPLGLVAASLGYADQAHLTREARALLGLTPGALRAAGNLQDAVHAAR